MWCLQAIAEVQKRVKDVPLLTEKDLQLDKSQYKKQRRSVSTTSTPYPPVSFNTDNPCALAHCSATFNSFP